MRRLVIIFFLLLTFYFLHPTSTFAQSFGCEQAGISSPCVLQDFACGEPLRIAATSYCNSVPGSECYPISPLYPCSILPSPIPTPVPTTPPASLPLCPTPFYCLSNPDLCENIGGIIRNNQYRCSVSYQTCCDRTGIPTPTPTTRPVGSPTPTPTQCTSFPCDTTLFFVCPGTFTCCSDVIYCPSPNPINLPVCNGDNDCQLDWDGGGGGINSARIFDMYRNCVSNTVGTTTTVSCKLLNCPPSSGGTKGIFTALGCIPIDDPNSTVSILLSWLIGLAGSIAFISLIYAAFLILTSGTNPQGLQAGKELAANVIITVIFLALSVVILNFIGVNVLGLGNLGFSI